MRISGYRGRPDVVVLGLARGGVPVAFEIAEALDAPLDVVVVRKIGMPGQPEFAIGAIASGGIRVLSHDIIATYEIPVRLVEAIINQERDELQRRDREYRQGRALTNLRDKTVILVDDGLATGSTMRAAVDAVRTLGPDRVVVAAPVGAPSTCDAFAAIADEVVCARMPEPFAAVGRWYGDFSQTTDAEVQMLLRERGQHEGNQMAQLIHEHHAHIRTPEGLTYRPRTYASARPDGIWEAWLEFVPMDPGAPRLRTERDSTQTSRQAVEAWALGLEGAYLEGAFARAFVAEHARASLSKKPD